MELTGPGRSRYNIAVKAVAMQPGNHLKHAFHVDGLGAPWVDDPVFSNGLKKGCQVLFAMEVQKHICVKIHKNDRYGLAVPAHPAVFCLQLVGCHQGA